MLARAEILRVIPKVTLTQQLPESLLFPGPGGEMRGVGGYAGEGGGAPEDGGPPPHGRGGSAPAAAAAAPKTTGEVAVKKEKDDGGISGTAGKGGETVAAVAAEGSWHMYGFWIWDSPEPEWQAHPLTAVLGAIPLDPLNPPPGSHHLAPQRGVGTTKAEERGDGQLQGEAGGRMHRFGALLRQHIPLVSTLPPFSIWLPSGDEEKEEYQGRSGEGRVGAGEGGVSLPDKTSTPLFPRGDLPAAAGLSGLKHAFARCVSIKCQPGGDHAHACQHLSYA